MAERVAYLVDEVPPRVHPPLAADQTRPMGKAIL
jgi:hypothetical protein